MLSKTHNLKSLGLFILLVLTIISCKTKTEKDINIEVPTREIDTSSVILKYNNTVFTIPSSYQAAYIIKQNQIEYNKALINPAENVSNYTTNFNKALNIGIYGTDLSYLNMYEQIPDVISYFTVIKKLSQELNIQSALQVEIINKIEKNIDNPDTLLHYLTNTYKQIDSYLKASNRKEIGVLIVTGGWIESLYILTQTALETKNRQIINRLGEQKHPLDNLIEILSPYYYNSDEYTVLIDALVDLAYEFDGIVYTYSYEEPVTDKDKKHTLIKSKSNIVLSDYHLKTITNKIASIRNKIIY